MRKARMIAAFVVLELALLITRVVPHRRYRPATPDRMGRAIGADGGAEAHRQINAQTLAVCDTALKAGSL